MERAAYDHSHRPREVGKVLIGSYQHTVDDKGRIFIPSKLKNDLGNSFVLVRGIGKNLMAFSEKQFESFVAKYQELPLTDARAQDFFRLFFATACSCEPDKQGRVVLPAELREYAGIGERVTIIGMVTRLEIWSPEELESAKDMPADEYANTLNMLAQRGV